MDKHIFAQDPFKTIDERGVGSMIAMAVAKIHKTNQYVKVC